MARLARWLRALADRLDPPDAPEPERWVPFPAPPPISDPIDIDALWRGHVADGAAYREDEDEDVYRGGGVYL